MAPKSLRRLLGYATRHQLALRRLGLPTQLGTYCLVTTCCLPESRKDMAVQESAGGLGLNLWRGYQTPPRQQMTLDGTLCAWAAMFETAVVTQRPPCGSAHRARDDC